MRRTLKTSERQAFVCSQCLERSCGSQLHVMSQHAGHSQARRGVWVQGPTADSSDNKGKTVCTKHAITCLAAQNASRETCLV